MNLKEKIPRIIAGHPKTIVVLALILCIPALYAFIHTEVNYDILSYLPGNLNSMQGERILDEDFKDAALSIVIVNDLATKDILILEEKLRGIEGVALVASTADALSPSIPLAILPSELRNKLYHENSSLMIVKFTGNSMSETTQKALDSIRKICGDKGLVSGVSVVLKDTKDLIDRETPFYVLLAVIFSLLILELSMESFLVPFIFLLGIGIAILYNFGTNFVYGQISYITKALAAVLQLGVTMDFSIFLLNRYDEERKKNPDHKEAMAKAIENTFLTISAGALTEVAGFLALCAMSLSLGTDIGLVMAKGVVLGLVCTMTLLPALLLVFDKAIHRYTHKPLLPKFARLAKFVSRHPVILSLAFLVLLIPAAYGNFNVKQYYNIADALPEDLPSVVANNTLKKDFSLTCSHFILISSDLPRQSKKNLLENLEHMEGISSVLALEKYLGPMVPLDFLPKALKEVFIQGKYELIIANSEYKASSDAVNQQIDILRNYVMDADPKAYITGEGILTKDLISLAAEDFKRVDYVSILAIFIIILLIFSSLSVPFLMVGSIELSILINMAVPYFTGEVIPFIASIVIGCIQLGVTIDYAILLLTRYREELRNGLAAKEAMSLAVQTSARSIVTSALTLFAATFGVGLISQMALLKTLCMMIARGSIISMVIILLIMPALFISGQGLIKHTTLNWDHSKKQRKSV